MLCAPEHGDYLDWTQGILDDGARSSLEGFSPGRVGTVRLTRPIRWIRPAAIGCQTEAVGQPPCGVNVVLQINEKGQVIMRVGLGVRLTNREGVKRGLSARVQEDRLQLVELAICCRRCKQGLGSLRHRKTEVNG